ncbi:MAG TPA: lipoyl(octanoyl) transferase LipB [Nitrospiraceae bacterium]|nr:lipoyl(octanoyl) transferase LipB [Nitrospiraceae bacterium]
MSLAHESHLIRDFLRQRDTSLLASTPQEGALFRFFHPIPYAEAWALQKQLQEGRIGDRQTDVLMLLEHLPVYTLGRSTQPAHWDCGIEALRGTGASVQSVDRGGSITYHGPGQIVGYPILKLSHYCSGPKQYVRKLEEALIRTLMRWGITGYRTEKKPGVWVHRNHTDAKIASIGVRIDHGVTSHGFALNVDLDLSPFSRIMPCGLTQGKITSMAEMRQSAVPVSVVMQHIAQVFAHVFNIRWTNLPDDVMGQKLPKDHHLTSISPLRT